VENHQFQTEILCNIKAKFLNDPFARKRNTTKKVVLWPPLVYLRVALTSEPSKLIHGNQTAALIKNK